MKTVKGNIFKVTPV